MLLLGIIVMLTPWTIRNQIAMGSPVLLSTDGAWALFNAHNPHADGKQSARIDLYRQQLWQEHLKDFRDVEKEIEQERIHMEYSIEYMLTHPIEELKQIPLRIYHLHNGDKWPFKWIGRREFKDGNKTSAVVEVIGPSVDAWLPKIGNGYYFVVLAIAAIGLALSLSPTRRRGLIVPATFLYFHALHGILFFGIPRFHVPFLPEMAILAGLTVVTVRERLAAKAGD